jgi:CheY-like chemotaxis protein
MNLSEIKSNLTSYVDSDHNMRILIVDDMPKDEIFADFIALLHCNSKTCFKIDYAENAVEGFEKLTQTPFDVVVLDQEMGGGQKDGTALLRKLSKVRHRPEIVFITKDFNLIPASEIIVSGIPISFFIQKNAFASEMLYRAIMLVSRKIDGGQKYRPDDLFGNDFISLILAEVMKIIETPISGYMALDQQKQIGAIIQSYFMGLQARNNWDADDILQLTIFFLEALCGIFGIPENLIIVIRKFLDLEEILYSIPRYRDHFFHQVKVFLLGFCIINELNRNKLVLGTIFDNERGMKIWFVTSVFHDIGYPFEKVDQWLDSYFESVLRSPGDTSKEKLLPVHFEWGSLLGRRYHSFHVQEIPRLICEIYKRESDPKKKKIFFAELMTRISKFITESPDHGLYSSIILQNLLRENLEDYEIDNICVAVALHNDQISKIVRSALGEPLTFERDALSLMLAFCENAADFIKYGYPKFKSKTIFDSKTGMVTVKIVYDKKLKPVEQIDWNENVFVKYIKPLESSWKMSASNQYHIRFSIKYYCEGREDIELDNLTL